MNNNYSRFCKVKGHEKNEIIGFCLNENFNQNPEFCLQCKKTIHQDYQQNCYEFQRLKNLLKKIVNNLTNVIQTITNDYNQLIQNLKVQLIDPINKKFDDCRMMLNYIEQQKYDIVKNNRQNLAECIMMDDQQDNIRLNIEELKKILKEAKFKRYEYNPQQEQIKSSSVLSVNPSERQQEHRQQSSSILVNPFERQLDGNEQIIQQNQEGQLKQHEDDQQQDWQLIAFEFNLLDEAKELINQCNNDQALKKLEEVIQLNSKNDEAYFYKGKILSDREENVQALECMKKTLELNPNQEEAYLIQGQLLMTMRRLEQAVQILKQGEGKVHSFQLKNQILNSLGKCLLDLHRYQESLEYYDQLINLNPPNPSNFNNKATCLREMKRLDEAFVLYDQALILSPGNADYLVNKGTALYEQGKFDQALALFESAKVYDACNPRIFQNKGKTLQRLNRGDEALECFEQWMKYEPQNLEAMIETKNLQ